MCVYEWVGPARVAATAEKEGAGEGEPEDAAEGGPECGWEWWEWWMFEAQIKRNERGEGERGPVLI